MFLPSVAAARSFSVRPNSEGVPELACLALGFVTSAGYSENGEGGINPGDGIPMSSSGGRVTCMGISGVPMGDWLRGLELLLWAGVVRLDEAIAHSSIPHPSIKHKCKAKKKKSRRKFVSHRPEVWWTERSAHEASAAEA